MGVDPRFGLKQFILIHVRGVSFVPCSFLNGSRNQHGGVFRENFPWFGFDKLTHWNFQWKSLKGRSKLHACSRARLQSHESNLPHKPDTVSDRSLSYVDWLCFCSCSCRSGSERSIASIRLVIKPTPTSDEPVQRDHTYDSTCMQGSKTWRSISVAQLKAGDQVYVLIQPAARHVGNAIDEHIVEK